VNVDFTGVKDRAIVRMGVRQEYSKSMLRAAQSSLPAAARTQDGERRGAIVAYRSNGFALGNRAVASMIVWLRRQILP